mmetsp:Transcript_38593/g.46683  ORF Transcript_38593/g.46683 Transcript_38593/m.46683 type:complete len:340 (+) Transcript_38593:232-1251(+)|eukprot:CAMPEP_0197857248 /NCGR_PEP_ID=MMETSP1438-20131217/30118_1 /TAXON_ID=1461541 /ORGANISM="Pterosperma sp., Strain CCMP1384" /LENGTH=339 /DNA_ID=CAMNT_0043473009 /DNA_START=217 /DNA_END=1236 /DNA_ORIENTATION=+
MTSRKVLLEGGRTLALRIAGTSAYCLRQRLPQIQHNCIFDRPLSRSLSSFCFDRSIGAPQLLVPGFAAAGLRSGPLEAQAFSTASNEAAETSSDQGADEATRSPFPVFLPKGRKMVRLNAFGQTSFDAPAPGSNTRPSQRLLELLKTHGEPINSDNLWNMIQEDWVGKNLRNQLHMEKCLEKLKVTGKIFTRPRYTSDSNPKVLKELGLTPDQNHWLPKEYQLKGPFVYVVGKKPLNKFHQEQAAVLKERKREYLIGTLKIRHRLRKAMQYTPPSEGDRFGQKQLVQVYENYRPMPRKAKTQKEYGIHQSQQIKNGRKKEWRNGRVLPKLPKKKGKSNK